jgi:hypothetical protein
MVKLFCEFLKSIEEKTTLVGGTQRSVFNQQQLLEKPFLIMSTIVQKVESMGNVVIRVFE